MILHLLNKNLIKRQKRKDIRVANKNLILFIVLIFCALFSQKINSQTCQDYTVNPGTTISSSGTPSYNSIINVPDNFIISDVNVYVDISHTYNSDLDIFLISPNNTRVELSTGNGGRANNYNATFDDASSNTLPTRNSTIVGTFRPEGNLSDFNSENSQGNWTLEVNDTANQDGGTINTITLNLCFSLDSDNDGVPDSTDIDDDNDGILDIDEDCSGNANPIAGNGVNRDEIYIFDWSPTASFDASNGIQDGESKTVTLPSGLVVTATFSISAANTTNANRLRAVDLKKWGGSNLYNLYDTPSNFESLETGNGADVAFTVNFTGTLNGAPVSLNLLALDGEETNANESISFQTNGDDWTFLESGGDGGSWTGEGTDTVSTTSTDNGTTIYYSTNASSITVDLNAGGIEAVAFGLWFECSIDTDGDGIVNRLDLDSDGDGCPDTIEAGIPLTNLDLQNADVVNGNGTTNTTTSTVNAQLNPNGTDANNDGLNDSVDIAQDGNPDYTSTYISIAVIDSKNLCELDLSLTKTVDKSVPKVGDEIIFTIIVKNEGLADATGLQVKDVLPAGLTYIAANSTIPNNTTYNAVSGIWDISNITVANGSTIELKIAATVNTAGTIITNKAEVFVVNQTDKDSTSNSDN